MKSLLIVLPITALFIAVSWSTQPSLLAVVVTAIHISLGILMVRAWHWYRHRARRSRRAWIACLLLTMMAAITIIYPISNRQRILLWLAPDLDARGMAQTESLYARPQHLAAPSVSLTPEHDNDWDAWFVSTIECNEGNPATPHVPSGTLQR